MNAAGEHVLSIHIKILLPQSVYLFLWCFPDKLLRFFGVKSESHILKLCIYLLQII
jgi:hypothetical protein